MNNSLQKILPVEGLTEKEQAHINSVLQKHLESVKIDRQRLQSYSRNNSTQQLSNKNTISKNSLYDNLMYSVDPRARELDIGSNLGYEDNEKLTITQACYICSEKFIKIPFQKHFCDECEQPICRTHSKSVNKKALTVCDNCFENFKFEATSGNWFRQFNNNSNLLDFPSPKLKIGQPQDESGSESDHSLFISDIADERSNQPSKVTYDESNEVTMLIGEEEEADQRNSSRPTRHSFNKEEYTDLSEVKTPYEVPSKKHNSVKQVSQDSSPDRSLSKIESTIKNDDKNESRKISEKTITNDAPVKPKSIIIIRNSSETSPERDYKNGNPYSKSPFVKGNPYYKSPVVKKPAPMTPTIIPDTDSKKLSTIKLVDKRKNSNLENHKAVRDKLFENQVPAIPQRDARHDSQSVVKNQPIVMENGQTFNYSREVVDLSKSESIRTLKTKKHPKAILDIKNNINKLSHNSSLLSRISHRSNDPKPYGYHDALVFKPDWFKKIDNLHEIKETESKETYFVRYRLSNKKDKLILKITEVIAERPSHPERQVKIVGTIVGLVKIEGKCKTNTFSLNQKYLDKNRPILEFEEIGDEVLLNGYVRLKLQSKNKFGKSEFLAETYMDLRESNIARNTEVPQDLNAYLKQKLVKEFHVLPRLTYICTRPLGELFFQLDFCANIEDDKMNALDIPGKLTVTLNEGYGLTSRDSGSAPRVQVEICIYPLYNSYHDRIMPKNQDSSHIIWDSSSVFDGFSLNELSKCSLEISLWNIKGTKDLVGVTRLNLSHGVYNGEEVNWMDANSIEKRVWENLLNNPNKSVKAIIPLRGC